MENNGTNDLEALLDVDLDTQGLLSEAVIGERRLNPMEALVLVRACGEAIVARGQSNPPRLLSNLFCLFI